MTYGANAKVSGLMCRPYKTSLIISLKITIQIGTIVTTVDDCVTSFNRKSELQSTSLRGNIPGVSSSFCVVSSSLGVYNELFQQEFARLL